MSIDTAHALDIHNNHKNQKNFCKIMMMGLEKWLGG